ncbi:MAG TPA: SurA N-terminal domain-containing protein [Geobacteraceae bacterium]|nr:SurA N-terminal domain-containing protein [Geobacteraceae bacterium]
MLGIMRKYKQSVVIKIVFAVIVFSFIGTIFLVWGRGEKGLSGTDYAARVGKAKISFDEYQKYLYRLRNIYSQIYGRTLTPEMEQQMGLKKRALANLIDNALVRNAAGEMGIEVSKEEVEKEIASVPAFQKDGAFSFQLYQERLRGERMTPSYFEENVKDDLLIKKAKQKILEKAKVSDEEALQTFRKQNDRVNLLYASFSPADAKGEVKLSEQDLEGYLQRHQEQFRTPEQISLSYVVVDPAKIAAGQHVTDEEAQTFYQKNIDRFQGKDGFLPFAEVKERAKAAALQDKGAKAAYEMAADAVNKNLKTADINKAAASLGVKVTETPLFTQTAPAAQLAGETEVVKRAFSLKEGELGGPVETSKGIYIFRIKERQPAAVPPLARIRGRVEALASVEKAEELSRKKADEAIARMGKAGGLPKMEETGAFGYSPKGEIPKIGVNTEIMEAAFTLSATAPLAKSPFKVGERWYVISLKERIEANKDEFPKQKEQIKQQLLPKKQEETLSAWLKELRGKTKIEINPSLTMND